MKPTFLVSVSVSLLLLLSFVPFSFFVCLLSLQAHPPVAAVAGHSLIQLDPQEGDRTDTCLGGLFVPSTRSKICTLYLFQIRHRLSCHTSSKDDRSIESNHLFC